MSQNVTVAHLSKSIIITTKRDLGPRVGNPTVCTAEILKSTTCTVLEASLLLSPSQYLQFKITVHDNQKPT